MLAGHLEIFLEDSFKKHYGPFIEIGDFDLLNSFWSIQSQ